MLKPEQVPDEVVEALQQCLNGCDCDECLAVCIAAAINAWPNIERAKWSDRTFIIPLPQETRDDA